MPENNNEKVNYTASVVTQGEHRFYTLTMPADVLANTCFVVARDENPEEGFQRLLNKERAQQIADYIDSGLGTIPTSVVLSAQPEAEFTYNGRTKSVSFIPTERAFLVLDGQHRVYGFRLSNSNLRVPVVIYSNLNKKTESRLFIDINTKQKPVPNELILDIRRLAEYQNDEETILGEVFDLFDTEPASPLLGLMSPAKRAKGKISRVTFNAALKPILRLFGEANSTEIYEPLSSYVAAFRRQNDVNKPDIEVTDPIVFRALMAVFPDISQRVQDKHGREYTVDNFEGIFEEMLGNLKNSTLKAAGKSVKNYAEALRSALKPRSIF